MQSPILMAIVALIAAIITSGATYTLGIRAANAAARSKAEEVAATVKADIIEGQAVFRADQAATIRALNDDIRGLKAEISTLHAENFSLQGEIITLRAQVERNKAAVDVEKEHNDVLIMHSEMRITELTETNARLREQNSQLLSVNERLTRTLTSVRDLQTVKGSENPEESARSGTDT